MLITLPVEVISVISSHLSFDDKVSLIATCRKLHTSISRTNLYENLNLLPCQFKSRISTQEIIQKFEAKKLDGSQVKTLEIVMDELSEEQYSRITAIFPNVTTCKSSKRKKFSASLNRDTSDPLLRWKDTIKTYSNRVSYYDLQNELKSNTFSRLTELDFEAPKPKVFEPLHLLPILTNTPSLKMLNLKGFGINLEFFERLHESCSYIRSLVLTDVLMIVDDEYLPISITQAINVLNLEMNNVLMLDKSALFLDHVLNKYTNLSRLSLSLDMDEDEEAFRSKIEGYYEGKMPFSTLLDNFYATFKVYRAGNHEFLSRLQKSLHTLRLKSGVFDYIIEPLSLSGSNLIKLDIHEDSYGPQKKYSDLNQLEGLEKLSLLKTLILPISPQLQQYSTTYATITKLGISLQEGAYYLDWILAKFPYLEELYINNDCYNIKGSTEEEEEEEEEQKHLQLKWLSIRSDGIHHDFLRYARYMVPNLRDFHLSINELIGSEVYTIDLSNWNIANCSISFDHLEGRYQYVVFNVTICNVTERLVFNAGYNFMTLLPPNHVIDPRARMKRFSLICDDIQNLKIHHFSIHRDGKGIKFGM